MQGQTLLGQPDKAWQQANSKTKKLIFDFIFEENIKVVNGKIGTVKYTLPYRLMSNKRIPKNRLVELLVQNWNQLLPYFKKINYVSVENSKFIYHPK